MDRKYIFFIDIDGTLIPSGGTEISQTIVKKIERLKELGHIFVVSTGRAFYSTLKVKGIEVFQYLSVLLGNSIFKMPEQELLNKAEYMSPQDVEKFIACLNKENIEWSYKNEIHEKTIFIDSQFYKNKKNVQYVNIDEFKSDLLNNRVMQLLTTSHISEKIMNEFSNFNFFLMPKGYTDITLKGSSKARCIEFFKKKYPDLITVSIGDSFNDIPMFENTDISIAMGNAEEKVKEKVDFVTKNIDDDGLIYAFRNILKI